MTQPLHPQTLAIRGAKEQTDYNEHHQALFLTSSFMFDSAADGADLFAHRKPGFTYSRTANPTVSAFARRIALLEGGEAGIATGTGMAAISLFGTTLGFIQNHITRFGIEVTLVPQTDPAAWRAAVKPNTKMLFVETPSNPLNEVADIAALAEIAHSNGALLTVDNCFCSPALQQPLKFGADLSVQSATKAIDGHGRVMGGVVCGRAELMEKVAMYTNSAGLLLSPFNAWVLLSGCETLPLRVEKQSAQAQAVAEWLEKRSEVAKVYYSGLPNHPQAALSAKQQSGGGIVVAFELKGGQSAAWQVIDRVKVFSKTANLGDVRSTITHPWTTTHCRLEPQAKLEAGIREGLIRLSIGLEDTADLIADLQQALESIR